MGYLGAEGYRPAPCNPPPVTDEALRNTSREKEETPPLENDYFKETCLSSLSFSKMLYLNLDVSS